MAANAPALERLYSLRELQEANYGDRMTLLKRIHNKTLPAVKVGNAFRVRERDLAKIATPVESGPVAPAGIEVMPSIEPADALGDYVKALVDTFPTLTSDQKATLGQLLAPAA